MGSRLVYADTACCEIRTGYKRPYVVAHARPGLEEWSGGCVAPSLLGLASEAHLVITLHWIPISITPAHHHSGPVLRELLKLLLRSRHRERDVYLPGIFEELLLAVG